MNPGRFWIAAGIGLWLAASCVSAFAKGQDVVAYAPDVVGVNRLLLVALNVPPEVRKIDVQLPPQLVMLDRTPLPTTSAVRKFYFRTTSAAKKADIRFALPQGEVVVSVEIWSYEDLRQYRRLQGVQLPRRWPLGKRLPQLKQAQTITTDAIKASLKGSTKGANWLSISDEQIWDLQPDSTIPRWHWTNIRKGCPIHGAEIYRKRAYYPWQFDSSIPLRWKMTCPIGGEEYPSNDFAAGDMTSGPFPDDGIGGACQYHGERYGFIAELCQYYCRRFMSIAPECADGYVGTGDTRYAHKALVAMCRLADEFAYLATMTQHRHRNNRHQVDRLGQGLFREGPCLSRSGLTVYPIELPMHQMAYAEAYDKIFPAVDQDSKIIPLLQRKGYAVDTHEDVRRLIEENLFAVWMQASIDGACASNEPYSQWGFARMAEMLNDAAGTDFMDQLYDGTAFEFTPMRIFVPNTYFRDGAPFESTGGYNGMHVRALPPIVESVEHLRRMRPSRYPRSRYPDLTRSRRYRQIFDFSMDTVTIDRTFPSIGDGGDFPHYRKLGRITWHSGDAAALEHAYRVTRDPKFAWALAGNSGWQPSVDFPFTRQQIEQEAARWPVDWNDASSLHDGYGISILRSGHGDGKRALWMMHGRTRGHRHDDIMDLGLDARQGKLLSHMGYPRQWSAWEGNWITHNLARQLPAVEMTATAQLLVDAGPVHVGEALARGFVDRGSDPEGYRILDHNWQRRMLALIDVDQRDFYCLDFYRIHGGEQHWWSFHAQPGDFRARGLELPEPRGGTLAGRDVPYGDSTWLKANGCSHGIYGWRGKMYGLAHLYNVQQARQAGQVWSADWTLQDAEELHLRLTVASAEGANALICDGKSPAGGSPYQMKWVLLHHLGNPPVKTQVISAIEAYRGAPVIRRIRPVTLSGPDEAGLAAMACRVELGPYTDTVFAAADPRPVRTAETGFSFSGRFGFCREDRGQPVDSVLIGGTRLSKGPFGVRLASPEYRGTITHVDRRQQSVIVAPAPPEPGMLAGQYVYVTNHVRRVGHKVVSSEAVPGGVRLELSSDSRIGTGKVRDTSEHQVLTDTPFVLGGYRYYHGARLVNADRTAEYRLVKLASRTSALIDRQRHGQATAERLARQFPPDSWFDIYDYGVGDQVVYPYRVRLRRVEPGVYELTGPRQASVHLPAGSRWQRAADGSAVQ